MSKNKSGVGSDKAGSEKQRITRANSYIGENVEDEFEEMKGDNTDNSYDLGSRDESQTSIQSTENKPAGSSKGSGRSRDDAWINNTWQYTVLVPLAE